MKRAILFLTPVAFLLVLGLLVLPSAQGQTASTGCKKWEVTHFNTKDSDCKYEGKIPYVHRKEWCGVPDGAEPVGVIIVQASAMGSIDYVWAIRRCVE